MSSILRNDILAPPSGLFMKARRWCDLNVAARFRGPAVARENHRLQMQIAVLSEQNRDLADQQIENARLRALLQFESRSPLKLWPAEVIALKPSSLRDSVTLAIGDRRGVVRRMAVLGPTGALVGQVTDVTRETCDALLLTDDLSSVGVAILPQNRAPAASGGEVVGICSGNRSPMLDLIDLPQNADIRPGDRVVTDGLGSVYPAGIEVGTVTTVGTDIATLMKSAKVAPTADLDHLQDVFVLPAGKAAASP
jgi:rod shape-determining protein MreC